MDVCEDVLKDILKAKAAIEEKEKELDEVERKSIGEEYHIVVTEGKDLRDKFEDHKNLHADLGEKISSHDNAFTKVESEDMAARLRQEIEELKKDVTEYKEQLGDLQLVYVSSQEDFDLLVTLKEDGCKLPPFIRCSNPLFPNVKDVDAMRRFLKLMIQEGFVLFIHRDSCLKYLGGQKQKNQEEETETTVESRKRKRKQIQRNKAGAVIFRRSPRLKS